MAKTKELLASLDSMFGGEQLTSGTIVPVELKRLVSYKNHPFKIYEDSRLDDMVESIKNSGVMVPIIVTPIQDNHYMILAGHNRVNAAKIAGLTNIPAIIKENISESAAMLIVTESNLIQRGISEMLPSEKAFGFQMELEALKLERKSTKKIREIEDSSLVEKQKPETTRAILAKKHEISTTEIHRYVSLTKLIPELLALVDTTEISVAAGVNLAFIETNGQEAIYEIQQRLKAKIDIPKSEKLKERADLDKLTPKTITDILEGNKVKVTSNTMSFMFDKTMVRSLFGADAKNAAITKKIEESLLLTQKLIPEIMEKYEIAENNSLELLTTDALVFYLENHKETE